MRTSEWTHSRFTAFIEAHNLVIDLAPDSAKDLKIRINELKHLLEIEEAKNK